MWTVYNINITCFVVYKNNIMSDSKRLKPQKKNPKPTTVKSWHRYRTPHFFQRRVILKFKYCNTLYMNEFLNSNTFCEQNSLYLTSSVNIQNLCIVVHIFANVSAHFAVMMTEHLYNCHPTYQISLLFNNALFNYDPVVSST